jgi:hypothetical protein
MEKPKQPNPTASPADISSRLVLGKSPGATPFKIL